MLPCRYRSTKGTCAGQFRLIYDELLQTTTRRHLNGGCRQSHWSARKVIDDLPALFPSSECCQSAPPCLEIYIPILSPFSKSVLDDMYGKVIRRINMARAVFTASGNMNALRGLRRLCKCLYSFSYFQAICSKVLSHQPVKYMHGREMFGRSCAGR